MPLMDRGCGYNDHAASGSTVIIHWQLNSYMDARGVLCLLQLQNLGFFRVSLRSTEYVYQMQVTSKPYPVTFKCHKCYSITTILTTKPD